MSQSWSVRERLLLRFHKKLAGVVALVAACGMAASVAAASAPERIILNGPPSPDTFLNCEFPTTLAVSGTIIIRSDGTVLAADFKEHFANAATGTEVDLRSAGTEVVGETGDLVFLESHGLFAHITLPGVGVIHINAGNITWSINPDTGELNLLDLHGILTDFPFDQVCDVLSH
jgi:hypothetical protein